MAVPAPTTPRSMPRMLRIGYLGDQETLLRETRATALFYFPVPIFWLLVVGAITYSAYAAEHTVLPAFPGLTNFWMNTVGPHLAVHTIVLVWVILLLLILLWILVSYLRWIRTVYAVTSVRVIRQSGIFGRDFDEIPIAQVRGVDIHQTLGQRILGYGTVRVSSEGGSRIGNEDWRGIPKPFEFQRLIENATPR
jgi:membrane protein YdbS with pleckstrin-like domain